MLDTPGSLDRAEDDQMLSLDEMNTEEIKARGDLIAKASLAKKQQELVQQTVDSVVSNIANYQAKQELVKSQAAEQVKQEEKKKAEERQKRMKGVLNEAKIDLETEDDFHVNDTYGFFAKN